MSGLSGATLSDVWRPSPPPELVREVFDAVQGQPLALMLYGSQARGTADPASDVDVLALVARNAGSYRKGRVNVTAYTPAHLHHMAQAGSLFVLHLRTEGQTLADTSGILAGCLRSYRPLDSPDLVKSDLASAGLALMVGKGEFERHYGPLGRLGIHLIRTHLYLESATRGELNFDVDALARRFGHEELLGTLRLRRVRDLQFKHTVEIRNRVCDTFALEPHSDSLIALAVGFASSRPYASALVTQVFTGVSTLDYTALNLPPL